MSSDPKSEKMILLEGEKELLLDHAYDGIQELDNPLPEWWKMTFYGGIIFGIPYFLYFVVLGGPTLYEEYEKDLAYIEAVRLEMAGNLDIFDPVDYQAKILVPENLARGAIIYEENCLACHADRGQGDIGPNLTDAYWIHGDGGAEFVYKMVVNGFEENGMPPWKDFLSKEEMIQVTAFVQTLKDTNIEGKGPEGNKVE